MLGVLIYELVTNQKAQGTPFSFKVCTTYSDIHRLALTPV